jgi:PleD family two-component response regulator
MPGLCPEIAHAGDMSQPAHKPVPEPTLNGYRALVIDDEQALADLVGSYLTRDGFELSTARDGQQAIDQARQVDPDVMVLDLGLPVIDGVEVCRLDLRVIAPGSAIGSHTCSGTDCPAQW